MPTRHDTRTGGRRPTDHRGLRRTLTLRRIAEHEALIAEGGNRVAEKLKEIEQVKATVNRAYKLLQEDLQLIAEEYLAITRTEQLTAIHKFWGSLEYEGDASRELYAMSDGYGIMGMIPAQGMDWSGIRDSTDEAVQKMYLFVTMKEAVATYNPGP